MRTAFLCAFLVAACLAIPGAAHGVQWERSRAFYAAVDELRRRFPLPDAAGGAQNPLATVARET